MSLKWNKLAIKCSAEAQEAVSNLLVENGAEGIELTEADQADYVVLATYFAEWTAVEPLAQKMGSSLANLPQFGLEPGDFEITIEQLDDSSWDNEWKKYYHSKRISRYLAIAPSWEPTDTFDEKTAVIRLDPGKSFGTGTHPTTVLALHALEAVLAGGEDMIDVGTGSGVLSIAAKYLGAAQVAAYDIDDESIKAAAENFALNPVATDVDLAKNSLLENVTGKTDIIVANILAEIIVPLIPQAATHLNPNGKLLLSGIIQDKVSLIKDTLTQNGFVVEETFNIGDWYGIIASQPLEDE